MFDYPNVVRYLIEEGADINALDKEHRSPLLLAASRGAWKTVLSLIRLGAQISIKDVNSRNVLHLVILNGGRLDEFAREVSRTQFSSQLQMLLNEKDNAGCSALHYASREQLFIYLFKTIFHMHCASNHLYWKANWRQKMYYLFCHIFMFVIVLR